MHYEERKKQRRERKEKKGLRREDKELKIRYDRT